jgi:hypothetical protein
LDVFGMPVTSRENQLRGNKLWGLPKVTQQIDIEYQVVPCRRSHRARPTDSARWATLPA